MKNDFMREILEVITHPERWRMITADPAGEAVVNESESVTGKKFQIHNEREIMMAIFGSYQYSFNGKDYDCSPGTVFLIDRHILHEVFYSDEAENLLHLWTYSIPAGTVVRLLQIRRGVITPLVHSLVLPVAEWNIDHLWDEFDRADTPELRTSCLQYLKLAMAFLFGRALEKTPAAKDRFQFVMMEIAVNRIRENLRDGIDVSQLARITGYSRFHFVRIFKQYTGGTVQEYVNKCRLRKRSELVAENRKTKEIASELGFREVHSYYNWLRKYQPS